MKIKIIQQSYFLFTLSVAVLTCTSVSSQIIPDRTLGDENSVVVPSSEQPFTEVVEGGATRGANLFHSFEQFSIPNGGTAYFNNTLDVQNIFSRVTGSSLSNIDGLIKANGAASLFLLNPNGIVFSPSASLNIGGSFLASTANSISFSDGTEFNAKSSQPTTLLTVNVPVGLNFLGTPTTINVQGNGHNQYIYGNQVAASITLSEPGQSQNGLRLQPGKTLALIGGNVSFEGGVVTVPSGQVEIGSVDSGMIKLIPNFTGWNFNYEQVKNYKDISLAQQSLLDASGGSFGNIHLQGKNINFTDGSLALIVNSNPSNPFYSGSLRIDSLDTIDLTGITSFNTQPFLGRNRLNRGLVTSTESAKGPDIIISAKNLIARDSVLITPLAFGTGSSGNLTINTTESIKVLGTAANESSGVSSTLGSVNYGSGQAGNVSLSTQELLVKDGGTIESLTFGNGRGGDVTINAAELLKVSGGNAVEILLAFGTKPIPSFLPSSIVSQSISSGNAGNIAIQAKQLIIENGGRISASGLKTGNSGNIFINSSESVNIFGSGSVNPSLNPSIITSSVSVLDPFLNYLYNIKQLPDALSGNVTINTEELNLKNGAQLSVKNDSTKNAGTLRVNAGSIRLDNQSNLTAATASGEGGNISLTTQNLQLLNGSNVTTDATGGSGNGGNITINTDILTAFYNSNITARAVQGRGGNINISTQGLFQASNSMIDATSQLGINGTVQVNKLINEPASGLVELPAQPLDVSGLVAQGCPNNVASQASSFVATGKGGFPENPYQPLNVEPVWEDLRSVSKNQQNHQQITSELPGGKTQLATDLEVVPKVEASSLAYNNQGEVMLVASLPKTVSLPLPQCHNF